MEGLELVGLEMESLELNHVFETVDTEHKELDELTKKIWTFCNDHGGDQVQILCHALATLERSTAQVLSQDSPAQTQSSSNARTATNFSSAKLVAVHTTVEQPYPTLQKPDLDDQINFSSAPAEHPPQTSEKPDPFSQSELSKDRKKVSERNSYKRLIVDTSNLPKQATEQSPTQRKSTVTVSLPTQPVNATIYQPRAYPSSEQQLKVKKIPSRARVSNPRGTIKERPTGSSFTRQHQKIVSPRENLKTQRTSKTKIAKTTKTERKPKNKTTGSDEMFEEVNPQEFFRKMFAHT